MPFFTYYGGKHRLARRYPAPEGLVVEPFAGSAGYSVWWGARDVLLCDADEAVAGTWDYLLRATPEEVLALPDLEPGQSVDDLDVCQEARWLVGWWLNKGSGAPKRVPSTFMLRHPEGGPYWGARVRERVAAQLPSIAGWRFVHGDYRDLPDVEATWFVDPPYADGGLRYRTGRVDHADVAGFCRSRRGLVVACEADGADWLPFRPLAEMDATEGRQKPTRRRVETVWVSRELDATTTRP